MLGVDNQGAIPEAGGGWGAGAGHSREKHGSSRRGRVGIYQEKSE